MNDKERQRRGDCDYCESVCAKLLDSLSAIRTLLCVLVGIEIAHLLF